MVVQPAVSFQAPKGLSTPKQPPAAPPPPPKQPENRPSLGDTVAEAAEDWGHFGKKLGSVGAVTLACSQLPMLVIGYTYQLPIAVVAPLGIASSVAAMALTSWEEKHLGIGRRVGQAVGTVAGAAVGLGKAGWEAIRGDSPAPEKIVLEQRQATGRRAHEPLVQRGIHSLHRSLLKQEPIRNRTIEIGEMIGSTATTLGLAYVLPHMVANAVGGPIGAACQTLIGPLCGLVGAGFLENTLGVGRALGELAGRGVSALQSPNRAEPKPSEPHIMGFDKAIFRCAMPGEDTAGPVKKAFFKMNHLIGMPIMGFLVDSTVLANKAFRETPYQTMPFQDRPSPQVNRQRLVSDFRHLAGILGTSGHEEAVGDELVGRLAKLGFTSERRDDGSIIATLPPTPGQEESPTVLLSAHQDTVSPTNPDDQVVGKRRIHTNGKTILGGDDRAGVAEILEGLTVVKEQGLAHPELKVVFTVDEERGLVGAGRLKPEEISNRPTLGFVVDALDVADINLTNDAVILNLNSIKYNFSQEDPLVQVAFRSMANAGTTPRPMHCPIMNGAGSDANTLGFNSKHIRSLAVGAGERDMHTPLEFVKTDDLERAARHVVGYITNSCDLKVEGDKIVAR